MDDVIKKLCELGRLEAAPKLAGKRLTAIIAPDRAKAEAWKRKHGDSKAAKSAEKSASKAATGSAPSAGAVSGEHLQIPAAVSKGE
jgi:hypothetical protein